MNQLLNKKLLLYKFHELNSSRRELYQEYQWQILRIQSDKSSQTYSGILIFWTSKGNKLIQKVRMFTKSAGVKLLTVFDWGRETTFESSGGSKKLGYKNLGFHCTYSCTLYLHHLRCKFNFQFSRQVLPFKLSIFTNIRWNHSFYLQNHIQVSNNVLLSIK